jgi:hypothetical protein
MRIITLLARHGTQRYTDSVDSVEAVFAQQLPEVEHYVLVADNAMPEGHEQLVKPRRSLIGSSNEWWEFSAWDSAIRYLGPRLEEYDLVHLATSAYRALDARHVEHLKANMLEAVTRCRAALGHIDCYYKEPFRIYEESSQAWLRSSWVFISPHELRRMGSLVSVDDPSQLFSGDLKDPFCVEAPISSNLQKFIRGYLTGVPQVEWKWHSQFRLTKKTLGYFQAKTLAILNEHMFSIRLRLQGCALVDATWLAIRQSIAPMEPLDSIPDWRWQVASRELVERGVLPRCMSTRLRAALVVGEFWNLVGSHGPDAGRAFLLCAVGHNPTLLEGGPVMGVLHPSIVGLAHDA